MSDFESIHRDLFRRDVFQVVTDESDDLLLCLRVGWNNLVHSNVLYNRGDIKEFKKSSIRNGYCKSHPIEFELDLLVPSFQNLGGTIPLFFS